MTPCSAWEPEDIKRPEDAVAIVMQDLAECLMRAGRDCKRLAAIFAADESILPIRQPKPDA